MSFCAGPLFSSPDQFFKTQRVKMIDRRCSRSSNASQTFFSSILFSISFGFIGKRNKTLTRKTIFRYNFPLLKVLKLEIPTYGHHQTLIMHKFTHVDGRTLTSLHFDEKLYFLGMKLRGYRVINNSERRRPLEQHDENYDNISSL